MLLKSVYVSSFLTAAVGLFGYAGWQLWTLGTFDTPWTGALIAAAAPTLFFARVFLGNLARTSARLWGVLAGGVAGTVIAFALGGGVAAVAAALVGIGGTLLYDLWYSRFPPRSDKVLAPGRRLPEFTLSDSEGEVHSSTALTAKPTVWLFYRGNWCPFCMAQVKEIAASYRELVARGAQVVLISPQSESHTRALAKKFDVPMRFLIDRDNRVARQLEIFAENGLPTGMQVLGYDSDVPMPTVFITAAGGEILYADLAENYRLRSEPETFLRVLDAAGATS